MKKYLKNVFIISILVTPLVSEAQEYKSAFGFATQISDNWAIVTADTISKNPDLLAFDNDEAKQMNASLISQIKKMALSGKIEALYYKKSDGDFYDNVNLFVSRNSKSDLPQRAEEICAIMPGELKRAYGRDDYTKVYYCKYSNIYSIGAINYSFDGGARGTRNYGYYFNTKANTITLTITCKNERCADVKADAELIFKNLKI